MRKVVLLLLVLSLAVGACRSKSRAPLSNEQMKLNDAAFLLETKAVSTARILYAPKAEHPFRITLDALVLESPYSLRLSGSGVESQSARLAKALRAANVTKTTWSGDVNWGIILSDVKGKELLRVGFDESGRNGYVGTDAVHLDQSLLKVAKSMMPE